MAINLGKLLTKKKENKIDLSKTLGLSGLSEIIQNTPSTKQVSETSTPEIKTLKSGGQYVSEGTVPRAYGSLDAQKGKERDHIIPVSLGGTSNDPNLQYLESRQNIFQKILDKPASAKNRQEGKMLVEWSAIEDYKSGKIGINEARQRVLNWDNQPDPFYKNYAEAFVETTKKTFGGLFADMARIVLPRSLEQKIGLSSTSKGGMIFPISEETKKKELAKAEKERVEYGFGISKPEEFAKGVSRGTKTLVGMTTANLMNWFGENIKENKTLHKALDAYVTTRPLLSGNIRGIETSGISKPGTTQRVYQLVGETMQQGGNKIATYTQEAVQSGWEVEHPYLMNKTIFNDPRNVKLFSSLGESIPSLGLAVGVTVMTGNPYAGAGILGMSQGADTYKNLREKGATIGRANVFGALDVIGTTIFERIPLENIVQGRIGMSMIQEGAEEGLQQTWSNLVNIWGGDDTRRWSDGVLESILLGAASGGLVSGFMKLPIFRNIDALEKKAKDAGVTDEQLDLAKAQLVGVVQENADKIEPILQQQLRLPITEQEITKITEDTKALPSVKKIAQTVQNITQEKKPSETAKIEPTEALVEEARKYKSAEEFVDKANTIDPSESGVFQDYTPELRSKIPLGDNIQTLDKTIGGNPNDLITVYRGGSEKINNGDFITTNRQLAQDYAGTESVTELKVRKGDIIDVVDEPGGEEYIYRENADKEQKYTKSQLEDIWKQAQQKSKTTTEPIIQDFSTHYERIKNQSGFDDLGVEIEPIILKSEVKKAYDFIQKNPTKAFRIAYGIESTGNQVEDQAIRQSLVASLLAQGKKSQAQEIARRVSKEFTTAAQILNLAKTDLGTEPMITRDITQARLRAIGEKAGKIDPAKAIEEGEKVIKKQTKNATEKVKKTQAKMTEDTLKKIDSLIDSLIC